MKRLTVLAILLLSHLPATAQSLRFRHLTIDDGLSQDIVTSIVQDERGFMWIGTEDGLNRYDGVSVKVYKHDPRDSNSLASNFINRLFADHRGHLWVSTGSGLDLLDITADVFNHVTLLGQPTPATGFCQASDSALWFGTSKGLFRHTDTSFVRATLDGQPITRMIWGTQFEGRRIWLVDSAGLHCYTTEREKLTTVSLPAALQVLAGRPVSEVLRDRKKQLWAITSNGLFRFDSTMTTVKHYAGRPDRNAVLGDRGVRNAIEDSQGTLWFGTMSGLEMYNAERDTFTHFESDPASPSAFLGNRVYSFCVDRTGILWIGTYRGGINLYSPARERFRLFTPPATVDVQDIFVITMTPDGKLLIGTDNGLFSVGTYPNAPWIPYPQFKGKSIFSIASLRNGGIWVGTTGSIEPLEKRNNNSARISLPVKDPVRLIFQDTDGDLWVGTDAYGLYAINPVTRKIAQWSLSSLNFTAGAWSMFRDRTGELWIGTWNSPYSFRYDKKSGTIVRYGNGPLADVSLSSPAIRVFREDSAGTLWLGAWGGGIHHLDSTYKPARHFSELDGLASDYVKSMEIDRNGTLWIGTERGLSSFNPRTETFKTYTQRDGLPSNFFFSGSSFKDKQGVLYFGAQKGFVGFDPDSIPRNTIPPSVAITAFRVLDKPIPPALWSAGRREVTLNYDQDFFSFEYIALDFTEPQQNRYAYMLEGFNRGWIQAGTRRYTAYTHLDPGTYRFHVVASNSDGIWNNVGAAMTVIITPAFWMTWWFRLAVVAIIVLTLYSLYQYRLRKLLEVERLRQRIARDLHDDIGTNLSAIVLASQMTGQMNIPPALREYVEDIRSVAMETQDHMRDIVWMLNPKNDSVDLLVSRMRDDAARLLREFHYSFVAPHELPARIDLTLKRNIFLIYKEALHNIVKHSGASHVEITVALHDGSLDLRIHDDGKGFDPANVPQGNGLDSIKERARQIRADLHIRSHPGEGTDIRLATKIA